MKAQSAMEYLMTYGWAILIVIIVAAALFALGVFNPATYTQATATGFTGFTIPAGGWQMLSNGTLIIQFQNSGGSNIMVTGVNASVGTTDGTDADENTQLAPNQAATYQVGGLGTLTSGQSFTASVTIVYNNIDTGLEGFLSTGTVTGTVV